MAGVGEVKSMAYEFIKTEVVDGVLVMTMHDPPTRNALGAGHGRRDVRAAGRV